jgi:diguanylate cyclase (GGDEF)-like protein
MPSSFVVLTTSVPLIVAAVLCLASFLVSYSFRYRRGSDKRLLSSYRLTLLVASLQLLMYAGVYNHWAEPNLLMRFVLASLALYGPLVLSFRRGFQRNPQPRGIADAVAIVVALVLGGWVVFDAQTLLHGVTIGVQGFARLDIGNSFMAFITLILSGVSSCFGWVYSQAQGGARRQARRFVILGAVMVVGVSLDISLATLKIGFPPVAWIGALGLMYAFLRDATENYSAAMRAFKQKDNEHNELYQKFIRDPLTNLHTRTHGLDALEKILEISTASIVFVDLDHFKHWNDRFGHAIGDRVLIEVAGALRTSARVGDVCARYAGDEFFIVLQDAKLAQGVAVAHAIRDELTRIDLVADMAVTASIGVTVARRGENVDRAMNRADQLAYVAKYNGKNCVVSDTSTPPERADPSMPIGR